MHGRLDCWVCLLVLCFRADAGPATLRLHLLEGSHARCNDGSKPGFYLREGSGVLLVWLEGGGDCGTQATCDARPAALKGSAHWPQLRQLDGIFSDAEDANPFFATATRVFVPYCSSDSWVGNREAPAAGYFFQGERIISAVLEELRNRSVFEGIDLLVFGGCSAGGRGALYNLDRVCSGLPATLRCRGFLDAAWWVRDEGAMEQGAKEGLQLWGPSESLAPCLATAGEHAAHLCLFGPHFAPYVRTPFLVHEEQFDYFMLSKRGVQRPVFLWSPEAWQLAWELQRQVKSTLPIISGRRDAAAYSATCTQHCFAESSLFWRVRVPAPRGLFQSWSLEQLARSWLQELPGSSDPVGGVLIDDCSDANCPEQRGSSGCPFEPSLRDLLLLACLPLVLLACCILLLLRRRWLLGRCRRRFRQERSPTPQMLGASFGEADGFPPHAMNSSNIDRTSLEQQEW
ncbi:notum2 [Symbiodinium sp. CCMP2456]|nr:notum2 [Symbiodinium sp. CCMP2456]